MTELFVAASSNPLMPPTLIVELFRRVVEAYGIYNLDLQGMTQMAQVAEVQRLGPDGGDMGASAGGDPDKGAKPAERTERRSKTKGEGTQAAIQQGARNVGGGRVPGGGQ